MNNKLQIDNLSIEISYFTLFGFFNKKILNKLRI